MISRIEHLPENAAIYARQLLQRYSLDDIVYMLQRGINHEHCSRYHISAEQWQDAVYVALKTMRNQ